MAKAFVWGAFALVGFFAGSASVLHAARPVELSRAVSQSVVQSLDGQWEFQFDPNGIGEQQKWFAREGLQGWQETSVPGSYNEQFANHHRYAGKAWYRRQFSIVNHAPGLNHTILHLAGVVLRAKIWVNGQLAGDSVLPYLDLPFDITKYVHPGGNNQLVIETDNSVLPRAIPDQKWHGWWNDGGLIWPVYVSFELPVQSDASIITKMQGGGRWGLEVRTDSNNVGNPCSGSVSLQVFDAANRLLWQQRRSIKFRRGNTETEFKTELPHITAWSPQHPALYSLRLTTMLGTGAKKLTMTSFGFRQIEVRGTRIYLNGEPLTIRGINRHEFYPRVGMSVPAAQNLKDLKDIKSLGANFVRLTHYPQTDDVYDDCDRLGLLVWSEMPAWQSAAATLSDPEVWQNYAAPFLKKMIQNHRNHPSVILWSVANEVPSNLPEVASYIAKAVSYVKQLDQTRLVTFASDRRERDISFAPVDVIAVNEYFGWYYGKASDLGGNLDLLHSKWPSKPIIVSEYGAGAALGAVPPLGGKLMDYSPEHQAQFLEQHLKQIYAPGRRGYVAGGVIWLYNDFPAPHSIGQNRPASITDLNAKGLVTQDRIHKPAWNVVQQFYEGLSSARGEAVPLRP